FFSDLKSGRSSSTVEVRLLRFWEARNIRCADELLLVDTNVSFVLGFLRSPHPEECFPFRSQSEMLALANTSSQLPGNSLTFVIVTGDSTVLAKVETGGSSQQA
ncbi:unnamed protein product, partial [Brassica rapa subsp. trilocularis]